MNRVPRLKYGCYCNKELKGNSILKTIKDTVLWSQTKTEQQTVLQLIVFGDSHAILCGADV